MVISGVLSSMKYLYIKSVKKVNFYLTPNVSFSLIWLK